MFDHLSDLEARAAVLRWKLDRLLSQMADAGPLRRVLLRVEVGGTKRELKRLQQDIDRKSSPAGW